MYAILREDQLTLYSQQWCCIAKKYPKKDTG